MSLKTIKIKKNGVEIIPIIKSIINSPSSFITIAASDSLSQDKIKADVVLTGIGDCDVINYIIDYLSKNNGGEIVLLPGRYFVDKVKSVQLEGKTYKYGLYVPHERGDITIRGIGSVHKYSNVSFDSNYKGATIVLTDDVYNDLSETDNFAVIGTYPSWMYSLSFFKLKNLSFYIPNFTKKLVVIDGKFASEMSCEEIFISSGANVSSDNNVNYKCVGIRACNGGNNGRHYCIDYCKIIGVGTAFHIAGEHLLMKQCAAQRCGHGYVFGEVDFLDSIGEGSRNATGIHNITMINSCFEYVHGGITLGRGQKNALTIIDLNCEDSSLENVWAQEYLIKDVGEGCFRGYLSYYLTSTSSWTLSERNIWGDQINGEGKWFETINLMAPKIGTTMGRPTNMVDVGFKYVDITLNKVVYRTPNGWSE